ncbi:MAG: hypothetical protein KZQ59_14395 [Candidatus Thiodiazotropha sp. (ex Lucinoma aequizonata)]|nr:hypothetical protein [Candidatus Thiodiazotropha sp. (ex Lucinoma aequizonata)]MCU7896814.1 hypothetical protein [Candidatus Thiodiazotropha sp. (ex Lucinoma aequizonata)]MCU7898940.1 hypothetical protein [Candidatus Thiodiazotropha sp. (ex Lucinoma aequizonata)]MCU7909693.1 hypothetical protein [Candidatus Thiodiazotropha sp. (ex Lucinoma aequizonata)]MCU7911426.1 hypothetical protein [Candidatus Thiodiazotropha sp. (ex Lucinoma aequizonata)]
MLNSHLIGFLALAKERVRLLPFGWHPGTQLLGAHLNSYGGILIPLHCGSYVYIRSFTNVRSKLRGIEPQGIQAGYDQLGGRTRLRNN